MDDFHNDPRQEVLFCIQQANKPVQRPSRQDPGQEYKELIVQPDGIDGLGPPLHGHRAINAPALAGSMPFCSSCSIRWTDRLMRPPYTLSPSMVFTRAAVKPVWMSPGCTAHTVMPKGRSSLARGHGIGVHRRLAGGIVRLERNGAGRRHRAQVHNAAPARLAHVGITALFIRTMPKKFTSSSRWASAVSVNSTAPEMPKPALFISTSMRPGLAHDLRHGGADLVLVGDVAADVVQALHPLLPAAELIHIARIPQAQGRGPSDAGGASGDDRDLTHGPSPARPP